MPLTPPKAIPSFDETRKRGTGRSGKKSPKNNGEELLIDFSTPVSSHAYLTVSGAENTVDPFSPIKDLAGQAAALMPLVEDEREAAARQKEVEESLKMRKQAALDHRAARRKSMANRRVSFAQEATLHTWNVVEVVAESTTSSASNSTRRQSSMTSTETAKQGLGPGNDVRDPPSTPPQRVQEPLVKASPAKQGALGKRRRSRSSGGSDHPPEPVVQNEWSPASSRSGSSAVGDSSPIHVEDSIPSSSDEDGDTAMSMDDATGQTVRSEMSGSSTGSSLDGRLLKASMEAGTRGIDYDENGEDLSMELAESSITNAFQPWVKIHQQASAQDLRALQDQENINPFSPAFKARGQAPTADATDATEVDGTEDMTMDITMDMTMDMTVAAGSILSEKRKISLQEFLDLINIRFIELSTTKRRHTLAPAVPSCSSPETHPQAACFAAAATTLPLLELYQHATRELKSYIASGRKMIRSIELETLEDQPALFREYVDARADVKVVMDNQFRNGKANARLQSKEGWYAWRRQLVEGLRAGLEGLKAGMEEDARSLTQQEKALEDTVPAMVRHLGALEDEAKMLQQRAEEFESIDHDSLGKVRRQLDSVDTEVAEKMLLLGQLQQQVADKADALSAADELKAEFQAQIAEAERVQDECRGWKVEEVRALRERVRAIERETGWVLATAEHEVEDGDVDFGPALTLRHRRALRLFFHPAAFQQGSTEPSGRQRARRSGPSAPISLAYSPDEGGDSTSAVLATQQRFFLQFLQCHLHALSVCPPGSVSAKTLLTVVSEGWDLALQVSEEIRLLEMAGITHVSILGDEKLGAKCMLMLPDRCRVDVHFTLGITTTSEGRLSASVTVEALPRYGSVTGFLSGAARASKVREALNRQATCRALGDGGWLSAVRGFEDWILAQKKGKALAKEQEQEQEQQAAKPDPTKSAPARVPPAAVAAPAIPAAVETPTPAAPLAPPKKELKRPVPIEEVMGEAAARQEEMMRRHEEEVPRSATKTPAGLGRRQGALRRSP